MTRKYFNGKCQEIKHFFSFHGCAYKHQLHISELYTYIHSTYISSFREYKRCVSEMTQISHKNLQLSDKIFVKCGSNHDLYFKICQRWKKALCTHLENILSIALSISIGRFRSKFLAFIIVHGVYDIKSKKILSVSFYQVELTVPTIFFAAWKKASASNQLKILNVYDDYMTFCFSYNVHGGINPWNWL